MTTPYDLIVLGGGTAGLACAERAAELGGRVLIVDAGPPGGRGFCFGPEGLLSVVTHPDFQGQDTNWNKIRSKAREWVDAVTQARVDELETAGVEFVQAKGRMVSPGAVEYTNEAGEAQVAECEALVFATGSRVKPVPSIPFDGEVIQTSEDIWNWTDLPGSVLIAGSHAQSLEWAFVLRRLGVRVFLVSQESELLQDLDQDLLVFSEKVLKKEKVKILLGKKITSIYKGPDGIDVALDGGVRFKVDRLLMCGQREVDARHTLPVQKGPNLGDHGEILADEKQKTTLAGVFAAGSVTGHQRCPYRSREEGRVAAANAMGKKKSLHLQLVARVLHFPDEAASVGCNMELAHHLGYRGIEGRAGEADVVPGGLTEPVLKLVFEKKSREIIGAQAIGPHAGDIIQQVLMGMRKGQKMGEFCEFEGNGEPFWKVLREAAEDARRNVGE